MKGPPSDADTSRDTDTMPEVDASPKVSAEPEVASHRKLVLRRAVGVASRALPQDGDATRDACDTRALVPVFLKFAQVRACVE